MGGMISREAGKLILLGAVAAVPRTAQRALGGVKR